VKKTRTISGRWDALSDEKIISQLQATLTKTECPVSRRAFSSSGAFSSEVGTGSREENASKIERQDKELKDRDNSGS
jgi:hypothetical protein